MNILIIYDTYSGGTQAATEYLALMLNENGHNAIVKRVTDINASEISDYGTVFFASPSWLENDKEGQPHINFLRFIESAKDIQFADKKFAFMGLGDESYAHFCNGIEIIKRFVQEKGGSILGEPLKIDSYYMNTEKNNEKIKSWLETIPLN